MHFLVFYREKQVAKEPQGHLVLQELKVHLGPGVLKEREDLVAHQVLLDLKGQKEKLVLMEGLEELAPLDLLVHPVIEVLQGYQALQDLLEVEGLKDPRVNVEIQENKEKKDRMAHPD